MNPLIQKENKPFQELELALQSKEKKANNVKKFLPESLENYLPKCILFYGNPHLAFNESLENFKIKIDYPVTDYYLRHFKDHYGIKTKRPTPSEMFNAMSGDMNIVYNKCLDFFAQNSGSIENLKNYTPND